MQFVAPPLRFLMSKSGPTGSSRSNRRGTGDTSLCPPINTLPSNTGDFTLGCVVKQVFGLTRREFLAWSTAAAALGVLSGCGGGASTAENTPGGLEVYRLSGRGRRISQAAKKHNANKLFSTWADADRNRAHPGDRSRIVRVSISQTEYESLFIIPNRYVVDLRHV